MVMNKIPVIKVFLALALSVTCVPANAEKGHYLITTDDGLSNSSINCFYQDDKGLMWFGTWDGLNVYDGSSIKVFRSEYDNEHTLLDNIVHDVVREDSTHLWVVTDWGVNRMDLETEAFTRFRLGPAQINAFSGGGVSLAVTEAGKIFCSSRGWGIAFYDKDTDKMLPFNISGCRTSDISRLACVGEDRLVLTMTDGSVEMVAYSRNSGNGDIDAVIAGTIFPESCGIYQMMASEDKILFASSDRIFEYDKSSSEVVHSLAFKGNIFYAEMFPDKTWGIAADRSRMYKADFSSGKITILDYLSRDNLLSFHCGSQDIVWLSIDGKGVEACCMDDDPMKKLTSLSMFGGKTGGTVSSMVQTGNGDIYVSVLGAGLCVLDSGGMPKKCLSKGDNYIFSMVNGPKDNIFIGVRDAVESFDTKTGRLSVVHRFDEKRPMVVYTMHYDSHSNRLYIGTLNYGLICLELGEGANAGRVMSETWYSHDNDDEASLSSNNVVCITSSEDNTLWLGTLGGGLNIFDPSSGKVTRQSLGDDSCSIPENNVRFLLWDDPSSLWIGTSYGLRHGQRDESGKWGFKPFDGRPGLPDNTVHSMIKDGQGRIWIATNNGLAMLDLQSGDFTNYTNTGSLQGKEFYNNSCLRTSSGEIYFGGVNGLNHFCPDSLSFRKFSPRIIIDRLSVSPDNVRRVRADTPVILNHNENFFTVTFSAVEYINNSNCQYSYKLNGFNDNWVTVSSGTPAMFTNVPPGKYSFTVKSTNGDRVWCDNDESFRIFIKNPWYLTLWAFLGYFSLTSFIVWLLLLFYRERRRQKKLLADEVMEKQTQKETYEAKLTFFTNIAHEFGTPLTLISCSGERLAANMKWERDAESHYVKIINDNAARMQRLIQELLEFRKVESGCYDLHYTVVDAKELLDSILDDFTEIGQKQEIRLDLSVNSLPSRFISDAGALEKIFINIISNAYKYTPEEGEVNVSMEGKDGGISAVITNTSKGLSVEKLDRVFDRFVIFENLERRIAKGKPIRNGVGMALVKSLVTALGGEIGVSSVVGKSVTFTLRIPSASEDKLASSCQAPEEDGNGPEPSLDPEGLPAMSSDRNADTVRGNVPAVLIVDDEPQIREVVADVLRSYCDVIKAANGEEAMAVLEARKVDMVITDMNMPVMNGMELLHRMKENELTRFIPVVILAIRTDVSDEINSYNLGSDAFIPKPFLPAQLTAVVNGILRNRSGLRKYFTSSASDRDMFYGVEMSSVDRNFIADIVNLVESNISEDLSTADIASHLCVSEMTLYRKVKSVMDKTPGELVRMVRLKYAANLLRTTSLTVQEVMFDSGFNNKSWFYRKFTEMYGMSPKEYRERQ